MLTRDYFAATARHAHENIAAPAHFFARRRQRAAAAAMRRHRRHFAVHIAAATVAVSRLIFAAAEISASVTRVPRAANVAARQRVRR